MEGSEGFFSSPSAGWNGMRAEAFRQGFLAFQSFQAFFPSLKIIYLGVYSRRFKPLVWMRG